MKPSSHTAPKLCCAGRVLAAVVLGWLVACAATPTPAPESPPETGASADAEAIAERPAQPRALPGPPIVPAFVDPSLPEEELDRYKLAAAYSAERSGRLLLVLRGGEVVFELGQNGFAPGQARLLYSASASFWGLLGAAADADGLLDLDEPAAFAIREFQSDPWKSDVRIRQLLNGTSGIAPGTAELRIDRTEDLTRQALGLQMVARPGDRFQYGPSHSFIFAEVLRRKLDSRADDPIDYLRERILDPIGLSIASWERDQSGKPDVAFGANVTAREWAKLGILMKNRGQWEGREIVPGSGIAAVTEGSRASPEHGLGWWLNIPEERGGAGATAPTFYPRGLPDMVVAAGVGNQRLYVIPSLDLVVVRFGERHRHWLDREFLERLLDGRVE